MWKIPRILVNRIFSHAQRSVPEECVGVLAGNDTTAHSWHPLTNTLHDARRFLADPAQQIALFKEIRAAGKQVIAIYHSHPTGTAAPSTADLEESNHPDTLNLIVALGIDGRMDMNGFLIRDGRAEPQEIEIIEA
ncbi:MAG: M67 family metallopeptidase [Magnetococcales bacterium]|nr:M67 family metallopeptidase [Magnetococcales bacterium]